ncbi:S-type anion channel SLAH2 [Cryptomeria japonica]|uniref:S-type anion channel SLAH2 n=1 Tax=Cryptomeria japonica TaxID=3369 RepID=UPI0025AD7240|nr:S-type anion channel SLAH2 [Cryptomeria japonica]XP_057829095.1 S-type anion channel SLAH2 [Cryptomeria japonica]XP_057829097.1 S-type anion channel SLAH2 [Cryptomeria japonica]XP_057829098.1 S-type anion channel SLAH2 [Cryptomeria japonica]XP_057829099.1 S-type anion channel SLAH2 [Cryptomeria japonica]XP_057829100.1 S-type anion channel SLAH2 [Cryptomeria japonica]XP_057829101.1 S-type anion channel SLAH2 [Cryptomeria japonica]XP_057829102.1 S-type anion channel SLAH2 [Cryptomeria japon
MNMEQFTFGTSAEAASPENLPQLLQVISTEKSLSFDKYDGDIENPCQAIPKATSGSPLEQSPMRTFNAAAAIPSKNKPDRPPHQPRYSVGSGSPLPSHLISISMPSSPAKFQMEQAKKVSFRTQKAEEDAEMSKLRNPSNVSLNFAKIKPRKQVKAYSQPIPTGNAYAEAIANGTIPNFSVDRRNFDNRTKDNSYAYFKTRSGKIEHQISRLRGKPVEGDGGVCPGDCEIESLPAGRYFDALQGPELEILRESEELVVPSNNKWPFLLRFPVSFFGVSLGVGSQAILWKTLAATPSMGFLHVPEIINLVLWCVALLTFIIILAVYASKCIYYFEAVRREYYHPVRVNFFFAPWIACMFLAIGLPPYIARAVHPVVWCVCMTPLLCLELKIYGQWMSGGDRRLSKVANPSNHLSIVGNFVGALLGAITGWKEGALFFFAVGLAHYIVLFVTLYQRLPTNETLPQDLHPVFFLFVAAPSVASVAWERIQGDFDSVSKIAYFIALFLYASLAVRINFFRGFRFSIAWWAYTFPTTGAAIATIKYSNQIRHPFTQSLAVILASISSLTVFSMLVSTLLHAFVWGTLFPNDIAIAITDRKGRARKKNKKSSLQQKETVNKK